MEILVDNRERKRIPEILKYYDNCENTNTTVTMLDTGDFIFHDERGSVAFEWKEVPDFIASVKDKRVFNQSVCMYEEFTYHFVIIVGTDLDKENAFVLEGLQPRAYYAAIAKLNTFTTVLTAPDNESAFYLMQVQAEKCLNDEFVYKRLDIKSPNPAQNLLLMCKHIGDETAVLLTDELGLYSFQDISKVTYSDLINIHGIGPKTAELIMNYIGETLTCPTLDNY